MRTVNKTHCNNDIYGERLRARYHQLPPSQHAVARFIDENREEVLHHTALDIAAATHTSDATVIRTVKTLGFAGLRELKNIIGHSLAPAANLTESMAIIARDVNAGIDRVLATNHLVSELLSRPDNRHAITLAVALISDASNVAVLGLGNCSALAKYSARMFGHAGIHALAINRSGMRMAEQLCRLQCSDMMLIIAGQLSAYEELSGLREAKRLGIPVVVIDYASNTRLNKEADAVITIPCAPASNGLNPHSPIMLCLDMLLLSVAETRAQHTINTLKQINDLHRKISRHNR